LRSKKLLALVAQLPCQHCGVDGRTQAAHTNWGGGKGRGIKADDNLTAALCQTCHTEIDQGAKLSRQQRKDMWLAAHQKTVAHIRNNGDWPIGIPYPDAELNV